MPARSYVAPRDWAVDPNTWPSGPWKPGAPRYARVTAAIADAVDLHREGRSLRDIAAAAGIAHTSLSRLIAGKHVPDVGVVAALEDALGVDLWPGVGRDPSDGMESRHAR